MVNELNVISHYYELYIIIKNKFADLFVFIPPLTEAEVELGSFHKQPHQ